VNAIRSGAEEGDGAPARTARLGDFRSRPLADGAGAGVEDDQRPGARAETGQVLVKLIQAALQRVALTRAQTVGCHARPGGPPRSSCPSSITDETEHEAAVVPATRAARRTSRPSCSRHPRGATDISAKLFPPPARRDGHLGQEVSNSDVRLDRPGWGRPPPPRPRPPRSPRSPRVPSPCRRRTTRRARLAGTPVHPSRG
jgi:hypothetical protein